jgi:aryl-alcohol dehydrogenase-like predicted oxidoreductase
VLLQAIERHPFATALVPVNPLDCLHRSFTRTFLPRARERGVAVIAMKVYAGGELPGDRSRVSAGDLVRFALAQEGVAVAVPGADSVERWDEARAAALLPAPSAAEGQRLQQACGPHRGQESEWYKRA